MKRSRIITWVLMCSLLYFRQIHRLNIQPEPCEGDKNSGARETGLLIVAVEPGSPAAKAPLYLGDTLVAINDKPLQDVSDLYTLLASGEESLVFKARILRAGKQAEITINPQQR